MPVRTVTVTVGARCDGYRGCASIAEASGATLAAAHAALRRQGWVHTGQHVFCSGCAEARRRLIGRGVLAAGDGDRVVDRAAFREWLEGKP